MTHLSSDRRIGVSSSPLLVSIIILLFSIEACCQSNPRPDFQFPEKLKNGPFDYRKTFWGMSTRQVIASEGKNVTMETGNGVRCSNIQVQNLTADLSYYIEKEELVEASLLFHNSGNLIYDYKSLNDALTKKYGRPYYQRVVHQTKSFFPDTDTDILIGDTHYITRWFSKNTRVEHVLGKSESGWHRLVYSSKEYAKKRDKQKESLSDL